MWLVLLCVVDSYPRYSALAFIYLSFSPVCDYYVIWMMKRCFRNVTCFFNIDFCLFWENPGVAHELVTCCGTNTSSWVLVSKSKWWRCFALCLCFVFVLLCTSDEMLCVCLKSIFLELGNYGFWFQWTR